MSVACKARFLLSTPVDNNFGWFWMYTFKIVSILLTYIVTYILEKLSQWIVQFKNSKSLELQVIFPSTHFISIYTYQCKIL